jgi:hypothetical protein
MAEVLQFPAAPSAAKVRNSPVSRPLSPAAWQPAPTSALPPPRPLTPLARRLVKAGFADPRDLATFRATLPRRLVVTLITPCDDGHKRDFWESTIAAAQAQLPDVVLRIWTPPGDSLIPRGRNHHLHDWYFNTADDYALEIDSDIDYRPDDIVQTVQHRLPIIAGRYAIKEDNLRWCLNFLPGEPVDPATGLQRVATTGTGWFCKHRSVVGRMIAAADYWNAWRVKFTSDQFRSTRYLLYAHCVVKDAKDFPDHPEGRELSEDWSFCYLARKLGYDIWSDTKLIVWHCGATKYPRNMRRLTREEVAAGVIQQPDGSQTPMPK